MNQLKREEDRMSPVLLSVITDDPLHNDLTFRLVYAQTRRRSEGWERESVCSRRLLAQTTGTGRSGKPHPTATGTVLATENQDMGKSALLQIRGQPSARTYAADGTTGRSFRKTTT